MQKYVRTIGMFCGAVALLVLTAGGSAAQVGKSLGVKDVNTMTEAELAAVPGLTPTIAKAVVGKRPFISITEFNALLLAQGLTAEQAMAVYPKAFVHINLNTASGEEIMLIPGAGKRMAHEFDEYRPWKTYAQFNKEIGKYVGAEATAKLAQYTFIPIDANTASDEVLMTLPGANAALVAKIKAGRPYKTAADLEAAISKGVARFFIVQP